MYRVTAVVIFNPVAASRAMRLRSSNLRGFQVRFCTQWLPRLKSGRVPSFLTSLLYWRSWLFQGACWASHLWVHPPPSQQRGGRSYVDGPLINNHGVLGREGREYTHLDQWYQNPVCCLIVTSWSLLSNKQATDCIRRITVLLYRAQCKSIPSQITFDSDLVQ